MAYCNHSDVRPIFYGLMNREIVDKIYQNVYIYGGSAKNTNSPDWICLLCSEKLFNQEIDYLN